MKATATIENDPKYGKLLCLDDGKGQPVKFGPRKAALFTAFAREIADFSAKNPPQEKKSEASAPAARENRATVGGRTVKAGEAPVETGPSTADLAAALAALQTQLAGLTAARGNGKANGKGQPVKAGAAF